MNKSSKIALGILGAAAVGVVLGLLYTEEGKKITKKGKQKADEYRDQLTHLWKKNKKEALEKANGYKKKAEEAIA
jgi:cytochrome c-type biogenesis protein CcmH/NrfG